MHRSIVHIVVDAFYASIEHKEDPVHDLLLNYDASVLVSRFGKKI